MPIYYTTQEAADILKVTQRTVSEWVKDGRIRASMLAGSKILRISKDALEEFVTDNEIKTQ